MPFEALGEKLLRSGVAPRHVRRYRTELSEHLEDLTAEQRAAGFDADDAAVRVRARLGNDAELADAMLVHKEFRSWAARAPWAFFGVLPFVGAALGGLVVILPLGLYAREAGLLGHGGINAPQWFRIWAAIACGTGNFIIAPSLALGFVVVATRQRLGNFWPLLAVLLVALVGLQFQSQFPAPGHRGGMLTVGAGEWLSHPQSQLEKWPLTVAQILLTLLPGSWLFRRRAINR